MTARTNSRRLMWLIGHAALLAMLAPALPSQSQKEGNAMRGSHNLSELDMHLNFLVDAIGDEPHRRQREESIRYLLAHADEAYPRLAGALAANLEAVDAPIIIEVLPLFRRAESVPLLRDILLRGLERVSEAAGKALGHHPDSAAKTALLAGLASDLPQSVSAAADGLMLRDDASICGALKSKLHVQHPIARAHVFQAAVRLRCLSQAEIDSLWQLYPDLHSQKAPAANISQP